MSYASHDKLKTKNYQPEQGVSLYLTLLILSLLLGTALAGSSLLIGQLGRLKSSGNSVLAFYAADAGIERAVFIDNRDCAASPDVPARILCVQTGIGGLTPLNRTLANGATFELSIVPGGSGFCPAGKNYCVKSQGVFKDATRALRISR